jgi:DNA processing protein
VLDAVPVASPAPSESVALVAGVGVGEADRLLLSMAEEGLVERCPTGWRVTRLGRS